MEGGLEAIRRLMSVEPMSVVPMSFFKSIRLLALMTILTSRLGIFYGASLAAVAKSLSIDARSKREKDGALFFRGCSKGETREP